MGVSPSPSSRLDTEGARLRILGLSTLQKTKPYSLLTHSTTTKTMMNSWPFPEDDELLAETTQAFEQVGGSNSTPGCSPSHLANTLLQGLRGTLEDLLVENEDIHDRDPVYVSMASDDLRNGYDG